MFVFGKLGKKIFMFVLELLLINEWFVKNLSCNIIILFFVLKID